MNWEIYFQPAVQMGQMMECWRTAGPEERHYLKQQILQLPYLRQWQQQQGRQIIGVMNAVFEPHEAHWCSTITGDYFVNMAVPATGTDEHNQSISGEHGHDYYELIVVLDGSYRQQISGVRCEMQRGQVCMLAPGVVHCESLCTARDRVLFIGLSAAFVSNCLMQGTPCCWANCSDTQSVFFHVRDIGCFEQLVCALLKENAQRTAGWEWVMRGLLVRLYAFLQSDAVCDVFHEQVNTVLGLQMLHYLSAHLQTVTREEMASAFHFNPDYLSRVMQRACGCTYTQALNRVRMQRARELLGQGMRVSESMAQVGLSNKGHFNELFLSAYGILPGEYRRSVFNHNRTVNDETVTENPS